MAILPSQARENRPRSELLLTALFSATLFLAALLLFVVEPFFAKLILPRFGGASAVWNTCMLFFQAALLLGYVYSDVSTTCLPSRVQAVLHVLVLLTPFACLPLAIPRGWPPTFDASPVWSLLGLSFVAVGLPFFVVSTTAPTLQRWFAALSHGRARDPYFLYAASNAGSIGGLLAYPFLVERVFSIPQQARMWSAAYLVLAALVVLCALARFRSGRLSPTGELSTDSAEPRGGSSPAAAPVRWNRRLWWLTLAFIPSSLMLGVTTHISTDVAAVPLLWVLPLSLYLLTFVMTFAAKPVVGHARIRRLFPVLVVPALVHVGTGLPLPIWLSIPIHLAALWATGMFFHGRLAENRPPVQHLTQFYVWLSCGGVLGGVFNALIAPWAFTGVYEYPLVLVLACFLCPSLTNRRGKPVPWGTIAILALLAGAVTAAVSPLLQPPGFVLRRFMAFEVSAAVTLLILLFAYSRHSLGCLAFSAAVLAFVRPSIEGQVLYRARSFFGTYRVVEASGHQYRLLYHGTTLHGRLNLGSGGCEPSTYYHRSGPAGSLFGLLRRTGQLRDVAIIGLGTGSLACYSDAGERWTYYEIDPLVDRIARDRALFTFLANSRGLIRTVIGDGRLSMQREPASSFDLLVVDAFSSDAIPIHLTTSEAVALYLSRLRKGGVIAFHITNRYLDLEPALTAVARAQGVAAFTYSDSQVSRSAAQEGKTPSVWMVMVPSDQLARVHRQARAWQPSKAESGLTRWTDDSSSIVSLLK